MGNAHVVFIEEDGKGGFAGKGAVGSDGILDLGNGEGADNQAERDGGAGIGGVGAFDLGGDEKIRLVREIFLSGDGIEEDGRNVGSGAEENLLEGVLVGGGEAEERGKVGCFVDRSVEEYHASPVYNGVKVGAGADLHGLEVAAGVGSRLLGLGEEKIAKGGSLGLSLDG